MTVGQPQLRLWHWLVLRYPSWLSRRRPEHLAMALRMLSRVSAEEAGE